MRSKKRNYLTILILILLAAVWLLVGAACTSTGTQSGDVEADHAHAEDEADDHSHDGTEGDEHSHDAQGSTVIGEEEVKIDHHGNPVFDEEERVYEQFIQEGVSVEFTMENFLGVGGRGGELAPRLVEGEHAVLQFHITEADSGEPLAGMRPAVWLDLNPGELDEDACKAQVQGYLGGTLEARPMIDLNSYFILGMNKDNTISVIDPMVDVAGMTNLFAIMLLQDSAEDWAMSPDQLSLFVSIPSLNRVAVADLDSFQVEANLDLKGRPMNVEVQPDGRYAWVSVESERRDESGVGVIDAAGLSLAAQIPTGGGSHALAFAPDSRYAFVTNSASGTLSVVDTQNLKKVADLEVGDQPTAVAVSASTGMVYVVDQKSGRITVLDGDSLKETDRMQTDPGTAVLGISPDGAWGVAANPQAEQVYVFETEGNRITHAVPVKGTPEQITFTPSAAYIRSSSTPAVFVIPFDEINPTGNISVLTIPIGDLPPDMADTSALADAMFPAPDGKAMLISNPADDKIYFYVEGSQSPLGGYQGHTLVPRAVQVVDRSLKERSPGVYTGGIRIPQAGEFMVAMLLDDPQVVHCFKFTAKPNPELTEAQGLALPQVEFLESEPAKAGQPYRLQLKLSEPESGAPIEGVADVLALARVLAGNWNQRSQAVELGDGVYEFQITFPNPGMYSVFFTVPSLGLDFDKLPQRTIQVASE